MLSGANGLNGNGTTTSREKYPALGRSKCSSFSPLGQKNVKCASKFEIQSSHLLFYRSVFILVSTCTDTSISNAQCPAHTTNHREGHGVHCGHHKSAASIIPRSRTVVVFGACFALSLSCFLGRMINRFETVQTRYRQDKARAQHDDDGSGPQDCWRSDHNAHERARRGSWRALGTRRRYQFPPSCDLTCFRLSRSFLVSTTDICDAWL